MSGYKTSTSYVWDGTLATSGLGTFGGWVETTTYANNRTSISKTDLYGREVFKQDLGGHQFYSSFDAAGRQITNGGTSYNWYNSGRVKTITQVTGTIGVGNWDRKTTDYGYDKTGNRTSEKLVNDGSKGGVGYNDTLVNETATYDSLGRMLTMVEVGSASSIPASITYSYDAAGNIRRTQNSHYNLDQNGYTTTLGGEDYWFTYDAMNRLIIDKGYLNGSVIQRAPALYYDGASQEYQYDAAGQRIAMRRTVLTPRTPWGEYFLDGNYTEFRENYDYDGAGRLGTIRITYGAPTTAIYDSQTDSYELPGPVAAAPATGGVTNSMFEYDLMGRQTKQEDYSGSTVVYSRTSVYAANGTLTSDNSSTKRYESDKTSSYYYGTANTYTLTDAWTGEYLLGAVGSVSTTNTKNSAVENYSNTITSYQWWDGAQQDTITYTPNTASPGTVYTTKFSYDGQGTVQSTGITDGRSRTITFRTNADGQVIQRHEADSVAAGDPHEYWYRFGGRELGYVGNNGTSDMNSAASTEDRRAYQGTYAFRNGNSGHTAYSDFAQSGNAINSYSQGSSAGGYVVQNSGETLRSIASQLWGDASLWYKIAEANGLQGDVGLIEGQRLNLPAGISRTHHNAATLQPYDANEAIGNLSPTSPKPPKKNKCGTFGQILIMAVAVAVTAIATAGVATAFTSATVFGSGGTLSALAGGTLASMTGTAGAIGAGVAGAVAGSVVSQGVGIATGIQDKFSFKGVALAAISGGVNAGLGTISGFGGNFGLDAARGAASSVISQGIGLATGLQSKFSFAGVAAAGIGSGVAGALGRTLKLGSMTNLSAGNIAGHVATNTAAGIASAAARSAIEGTSFGDNLVRALPDVIGQTIGNIFAGMIGGASKQVIGHSETSTAEVAENGAPLPQAGDEIILTPEAQITLAVSAGRMSPEDAVVIRRQISHARTARMTQLRDDYFTINSISSSLKRTGDGLPAQPVGAPDLTISMAQLNEWRAGAQAIFEKGDTSSGMPTPYSETYYNELKAGYDLNETLIKQWDYTANKEIGKLMIAAWGAPALIAGGAAAAPIAFSAGQGFLYSNALRVSVAGQFGTDILAGTQVGTYLPAGAGVVTASLATAETTGSRFAGMLSAERRVILESKLEANAMRRLEEMQLATQGAHFVERHGSQLSLASQYDRAALGINPTTGLVERIPSAATRFFSARDQLNVINRAEQIFANTGSARLAQRPYEFSRVIGEGYSRSLTYGTQSSAQVYLNAQGRAITAFPRYGY